MFYIFDPLSSAFKTQNRSWCFLNNIQTLFCLKLSSRLFSRLLKLPDHFSTAWKTFSSVDWNFYLVLPKHENSFLLSNMFFFFTFSSWRFKDKKNVLVAAATSLVLCTRQKYYAIFLFIRFLYSAFPSSGGNIQHCFFLSLSQAEDCCVFMIISIEFSTKCFFHGLICGWRAAERKATTKRILFKTLLVLIS